MHGIAGCAACSAARCAADGVSIQHPWHCARSLLQDSYRVIGPQMGDITADIRAAMMRAAMQAFGSLFHLQASVCVCGVRRCTCVVQRMLYSHAILRRNCWSRFLQLAVQRWQTRALCTSRSTSPSYQQHRRPSSSQVAQSLPRRLQPCLRFWPLSPAAVRTQPLQPPCSSIRGSVATALQRLRRLLPCVDFRYALHQWTTTIPLSLSQPHASRRRIRPFSLSQPQATTALTVNVSVRIALVQARRLAGLQLDTAAALANNHTISTGEVMA